MGVGWQDQTKPAEYFPKYEFTFGVSRHFQSYHKIMKDASGLPTQIIIQFQMLGSSRITRNQSNF